MSTSARFAQISSCSTAAARNVSAAQTSGCLPGRLQQVRELADGRRLAGAVDADDQRHVRMVPVRRGRLDGVEDAPNLSLTRSRRLSPCRARAADRVDDAFGRGHADVGRDQQLFERLDRVDVDRPAALLLGVGLLDDLLEAADDLLLRPRQAVAKLVKNPITPS